MARICAFWFILVMWGVRSKRPPRVARGAKGYGGGRGDIPGHLRPMQQQAGSKPLPELFNVPTFEDFWSKYVRTNTPVVLRGHAKMHPAFERWTDEYLAKTWGKRVVSAEKQKSEERGGASVELTVAEFVDQMYDEDLYGIFDFDHDSRAKADFYAPLPVACKEIKAQSLTLWISSGGTTSVLHTDDAENFLMLLEGNKSVMLVHQDQAQKLYAHIAEHRGTSPVHQDRVDMANFPKFADVEWFSGELGPGDTLFIPHSYWHQVNSKGRNLAANLWFGHANDWQWWDPMNSNEFDATRWGSKGFPSFQSIKTRGPDNYPCTPLAARADLNHMKFIEEGKYKDVMSKKRRKYLTSGEL